MCKETHTEAQNALFLGTTQNKPEEACKHLCKHPKHKNVEFEPKPKRFVLHNS